jgi:hypothetical protein
MPIDGSMYLQRQGLDFSGLGEGIERGMRMRDMIDQKKNQEAIKQAYAKNTTQNPDGSVSFNQGMLVKDLAGLDPQQAMGLDAQIKEQSMQAKELQQKQKEREIDLVSRIAPSIKDQSSYEQGLQYLGSQGVDIAKMPKAYDKNLVDRYALSALSFKEQMAQQNADRAFGMDEKQFTETQRKNSLDYSAKMAENARKSGGMGLPSQGKMPGESQSSEPTGEYAVPGYGYALTKADAKEMKSALEMKGKFDRQINQLIKLREDYGDVTTSTEATGAARQLSKDLLLTYKNLAKLGVLSQSDEAIINEIIPAEPIGQMQGPFGLKTAYNSITGQDPALVKLKNFQQESNDAFADRLATRMRGGQQMASQMREANPRQQNGSGINASLIPEANAASQTNYDSLIGVADQMNQKDIEALKFAGENPKDPRAYKILQTLGTKYGGQ